MPSQHDNDNPEPVIDTYAVIKSLENENKGLKSELTKSKNREAKLEEALDRFGAKVQTFDSILNAMSDYGWRGDDVEPDGYYLKPLMPR